MISIAYCTLEATVYHCMNEMGSIASLHANTSLTRAIMSDMTINHNHNSYSYDPRPRQAIMVSGYCLLIALSSNYTIVGFIHR